MIDTINSGGLSDVGAAYGLAGTLLGGIGVKVIEILYAKSGKRVDDAAKIRGELWEELNRLRMRIESLEGELDEWREKYFTVLAENTELKIEIKLLHQQHRVTEEG